MQTRKIEDYSLVAFMQQCFNAFKEGYSIDCDSNERAPVSFGGYYYAVLVKPEEEKSEENVSKTDLSEDSVPDLKEKSDETSKDEVVDAPRRGRKPKA